MVSRMLKILDDLVPDKTDQGYIKLRNHLKLNSSCIQLLISKLRLDLRIIGGVHYLEYWDVEDGNPIQIEISEEEYNQLYTYLGPKFKEMRGW